ncbi:unnamed protein product, partial [Prorocentrum cordatum]
GDGLWSLLCDRRYRKKQGGRFFVVVSLGEAATVRRILHARRGKAVVSGQSVAVSLQCADTGLQLAYGMSPKPSMVGSQAIDSFPSGHPYQRTLASQCYKLMDCATQYSSSELSLLVQAMQLNTPLERCKWFEYMSMCKRRNNSKWGERPISQLFEFDTEFDILYQRSLSLTWRRELLHRFGSKSSMSENFALLDTDCNNSLDIKEVIKALRDLKLPHTTEDVATYFRALDANGDHRVVFAEFSQFLQRSTASLSRLRALHGASGAQGAGRAGGAPATPGPSGGLLRALLPWAPWGRAAAGEAPGAPDAPDSDAEEGAPEMEEEAQIQTQVVEVKEMLDKVQKERQAAKDADSERYRREEEQLEEHVEEQAEKRLGDNPCVEDGVLKWDFQRFDLPKGARIGKIGLAAKKARDGYEFVEDDGSRGTLWMKRLRIDRRPMQLSLQGLLSPDEDSGPRVGRLSRYSLSIHLRLRACLRRRAEGGAARRCRSAPRTSYPPSLAMAATRQSCAGEARLRRTSRRASVDACGRGLSERMPS